MLALPAPNGENKDKDREEKPSLLEDIARCMYVRLLIANLYDRRLSGFPVDPRWALCRRKL